MTTKDTIMALAREAGLYSGANEHVWAPALERFAALVAMHEREACAKVCEEYSGNWYVHHKGAIECAAAIRARSNK